MARMDTRTLATTTAGDALAGRVRHYEMNVVVRAAPAELFEHLDDPLRLSAHMGPSWRMGGGRMTTAVDQYGGRQVGSRIRMSGQILGLHLSLEEVVTERRPPHRKLWRTIGRPRLLVMDSYEMGYEIVPNAADSLLRVFIDCTLPARVLGRWLGYMLGSFYARWCLRRIVEDAARRFEPVPRMHIRRSLADAVHFDHRDG